MINKIEGATAAVVQSGTIGSNTDNGNGFAEELAKQMDDQNKNSCCKNSGNDPISSEYANSVNTNTDQ